MMTASPFRLESLPYQSDAVQAVVDVFKGMPRTPAHELAGNRCTLRWEQISANLQTIALRHRISDERLNLSQPAQGQPLDAQAVRDEVLLKCGFQLDVQLTPIAEVTANQLYRARDQQTPPREAIVCFDSHLDTTTLEWLRQQKGQRVIVLEAALDTTGIWNLHHQLGDGLVVFDF